MKFHELRRTVRLEVTGGVTTHLLAPERHVVLKDIGHGGFLLHSPLPIPVGQEHRVRFVTADGWQTTLTARSVHARRCSSLQAAALFAVGFAFVFNPAERTEEAVAHLIDKVTAVLTFD